MTEDSKAQEALQDAEQFAAAPPPAYEETATMVTETDGFQVIERLDTVPEDEKIPVEDLNTAVMDTSTIPSRTPSMLKEKGPAYPPRPSPAPPSTDEAPVNDEKDIIAPVVESKDATPVVSTAEEEKKALQVHFADEEPPPTLPRRPTTTRFSENFSHDNVSPDVHRPIPSAALEAPGGAPVTYTFTWHRPRDDFPTLQITPSNGAVIPSSFPDIPPTASWRLNYDTKYHACLHRYTASPSEPDRHTSQAGDFPFRRIAEFKFPDIIIPGAGCGAVVKFDPHEEEIARLGNIASKTPHPRVQKFMQCAGWFSTRYSMEIPVLDHLQTTWKPLPRPSTTRIIGGAINENTQQELAIVERKTTDISREAKKRNVTLVTLGDLIDQARRTLDDETWTPYAPQQLLVDFDGRPIATYQRASPWAKFAGTLTIHHPQQQQQQQQQNLEPSSSSSSFTPEFLEGIIISTSAMVAMQDRIGLSSGLIDVANSGLNAADKGAMWSAEQWRRAQREWKNRRAGAGGKNTTTTGTAEEGSTREKEKEGGGGGTYPYGGQQKGGMRGGMDEDEGMVGSEVFDDENGLAGVLSPEEREKARREQMAWDEKKKKKSQEVERRVSSAAAAAVPVRSTMGTRDDDDERRRRQTMVRWEEKPKVVYA